MQKRYLLIFAVVLVLLALAAPALAYSTDFEAFASGTTAAALTVPGMSFSGATWSIFSYGAGVPPYVVNNSLQGSNSGSGLTINFAAPQSSVSFGYFSCVPFTAVALLGGTQVDSVAAPATGCLSGGGYVNLSNPAGIDSVQLVYSGPSNTGIDNIVTTAVGATAYCAIDDGRINNLGGLDCAAPVAIYPNDGGFDIYSINPDGGAGAFTLRITGDDIDAEGVPSDGNATLADGTNSFTGVQIVVFRLTTGEFQINTYYADGKSYIFVWGGANGAYHLAN